MTYIFVAEQVARQFGLAIATCDRQEVQQSVRNRVLGRNKMLNMAANIGDVTLSAEDVVKTVVTVVGVVGETSKSNAKRVGNGGRKHKEDGELPSY